MKLFNVKSMMTLALLAFSVSAFSQCNSSHKKQKSDSYLSNNSGAYSEHTGDIIDVAVNNHNFSTLVAAVKAADLVDALKGDGPFTVFAPTNNAFDKLPDGTVATLVKPENKSTLTNILTYHVVPGKLDSTAVLAAIKAGGGAAEVKTLNGGILTARLLGDHVVLQDENGNLSKVTTVDVGASNGVIHIIDAVVMPNK